MEERLYGSTPRGERGTITSTARRTYELTYSGASSTSTTTEQNNGRGSRGQNCLDPGRQPLLEETVTEAPSSLERMQADDPELEEPSPAKCGQGRHLP